MIIFPGFDRGDLNKKTGWQDFLSAGFMLCECLLLEDSSWDNVISNEITYDCCDCKTYAEESCESLTSPHESVLPYLVAPADCLECAPETVSKVEPESCEPDDVDDYHPDVTESELHECIY